MNEKTAIIIGAGPAGLTAAYELLDRTDVKPVIFEASDDIGGISKTVSYKGNRIDIGGHRFFSKSDRVMEWWKNILPLQGAPARDDNLLRREPPLAREACLTRPGNPEVLRVAAPDPEKTDGVMLVRRRLSRIFFLRKFFDYPITLNMNTLRNLGPVRMIRIAAGYLKVVCAPIREERSLEDFFINRFGRELYLTFFKDYTEKVWGVPCSTIKPEWGAQRIKGLSVAMTILHAVKKVLRKDSSLAQNGVETSLIEQFMYPKLGPGQLWEKVSETVAANGGEVHKNRTVVGVLHRERRVTAVVIRNGETGEKETVECDYLFSSMPVRDLVLAMGEDVPLDVREVASGLIYRDFITVGLLLKKMKIRNETSFPTVGNIIPDNWIYIQEREVRLGRVQVFNNWSPYMVRDADTVWLGLEYFCNEGDDLWSKSDKEITELAVGELAHIGMIEEEDVLDSVVIRVPKAYPAYFGTYDSFDVASKFTDSFENLFLVGRNGMHRYNNADHSMLTAMVAVDNIMNNLTSKDNIWSVNTEECYHEEKKTGTRAGC